MNYVKKDDVAGTWIESHFRRQIRTFWFGLLWLVVGTITYVVLIGWVILAADSLTSAEKVRVPFSLPFPSPPSLVQLFKMNHLTHT